MTVVATSPTALTTQLLTTLDLPDGQIILQGIGDGPSPDPRQTRFSSPWP